MATIKPEILKSTYYYELKLELILSWKWSKPSSLEEKCFWPLKLSERSQHAAVRSSRIVCIAYWSASSRKKSQIEDAHFGRSIALRLIRSLKLCRSLIGKEAGMLKANPFFGGSLSENRREPHGKRIEKSSESGRTSDSLGVNQTLSLKVSHSALSWPDPKTYILCAPHVQTCMSRNSPIRQPGACTQIDLFCLCSGPFGES